MSATPIQDILNESMQHLRELVGAETIIGKEIKTENGTTIIPVSKVSFGFAGRICQPASPRTCSAAAAAAA